MNRQNSSLARQTATATLTHAPSGILQRKCACGNHTIAGNECNVCGITKLPHAAIAPSASNPTFIQPQLSVSAPTDEYEQEATLISERIMRPPYARTGQSISTLRTDSGSNAARSLEVGTNTEAHIQALRGGGHPLRKDTRQFFESRFGVDFSHVRIHTGTRASEAALSVNAHAFTMGHDIVFGAGRYSPHTPSGQTLLAHELTHVVQQSRSHVATQRLQRTGFFEGIGIFLGLTEGNFTDEELRVYLEKITRTNKIEDSYDSDNKARAIVRKWKAGNSAFSLLTASQKILLIQEMRSGVFSESDQQGVIDLLENSVNSDLQTIFKGGKLDAKSLVNAFGRARRERLKQFFERRFKGGMEAVLKGQVEAVGAPVNKSEVQARLRAALAELERLRKRVDMLQQGFVASTADAASARTQDKFEKSLRSQRAANELWGGLYTIAKIRKAVRVQQSGDQVSLIPTMQIAYLFLAEPEGRKQAASDIPRIISIIQQVWNVQISSGDYAGITLSVTPQITYRPPSQLKDQNAWQIEVHAPGTREESSGEPVQGTIDIAPEHLAGARVVVVAHELAHLFGFMDTYVFLKTNISKAHPEQTKSTNIVGRTDPSNRTDLLGMIDPVFLKNWLDEGKITKEEYARQTRGTPHVWEEEASIVLQAFGIPKSSRKSKIDPVENENAEEIMEQQLKAEADKSLGKIAARKKGVENSMDWLTTVEAIMRLEKEVKELRIQLGQTP